jgi:hypothetical protein
MSTVRKENEKQIDFIDCKPDKYNNVNKQHTSTEIFLSASLPKAHVKEAALPFSIMAPPDFSSFLKAS